MKNDVTKYLTGEADVNEAWEEEYFWNYSKLHG